MTSLIFNMNKKLIDQFIVNRQEFLLGVSRSILKKKNDVAEDLLHDLFIYLYENFQKIKYIKDETSLLAFSVSWIKLQVKWKGTGYKKTYVMEYDELPLNLPLNEDFTDILHSEDPYIKDIRRIWNSEQADKLQKIYQYLPRLSKVNQILFQAYFIEGLTYDKIKDNYDFFRDKPNGRQFYKSKKSIYNLMKELKKELLLCTKL